VNHVGAQSPQCRIPASDEARIELRQRFHPSRRNAARQQLTFQPCLLVAESGFVTDQRLDMVSASGLRQRLVEHTALGSIDLARGLNDVEDAHRGN
jgi:hypothetical protein